MKLQKLDDLLLNLVLKPAEGVTPLRTTEAAKQLGIRVMRVKISAVILMASLATEGAMCFALICSLVLHIVSMVAMCIRACRPPAR